MSLLKQDIVKKRQGNKLLKLKLKQEFDSENNKKYKVEIICNSEVYVKEAAGQLPGLYYLVS